MAPVNIICVGMAGSGKTTFVQRLNSHLHSIKKPPYVVNLDPAVKKVPFGTNIDIRDAINYKKVMSEYNLGPNGAIMTSLNLFSTKIDQVLGLIEKRKDDVEHVLVDTPGQIEVFIWSASGAIVTDALASAFPTVLAYVVDTPRSSSPATFMSNMLYACSILYKTKLPMIVVFNKTDVKDAAFAKEWMTDFEAFQQVLRDSDQDESGEGSGYMGSLINSLSLMLEEFYRHLDIVGVSAYTGEGFDEFLDAVSNKVDEFNRDYKEERDRIIKERQDLAEKKKTKDLARLMKDIGINEKKDGSTSKAEGANEEVDVISDVSSDEDDGLVDTDALNEFEVTREHNFPDRHGEINDDTEQGIQDRYQQALRESQKEGDVEKFLRQINRSA